MPEMSENEILFETEGRLLVSRNALFYLFVVSLGVFLILLIFFRWIWAGYPKGNAALAASVLSACLLTLGGNFLVWWAKRDFRVRMTERALLLLPAGGFTGPVSLPVDRLKAFRAGFRFMYGQKATLVEVTAANEKEPFRLLVKDPEGLLKALEHVCNRQKQSMAEPIQHAANDD
jgi:hypothetical protein